MPQIEKITSELYHARLRKDEETCTVVAAKPKRRVCFKAPKFLERAAVALFIVIALSGLVAVGDHFLR